MSAYRGGGSGQAFGGITVQTPSTVPPSADAEFLLSPQEFSDAAMATNTIADGMP